MWFGPGHLAPWCSEDVTSTQLEAGAHPTQGEGRGRSAAFGGGRQRPLVSFSGKPEAGVWRARCSWGQGGPLSPLGMCWKLSNTGASTGRILQKDEGLNVLLNIPDSAKVVAFKPEHPGLWSIKVGALAPSLWGAETPSPSCLAWGAEGWRWLVTWAYEEQPGVKGRGGVFMLHRGSGVVWVS